TNDENKESTSLLEWISQRDNQNSLDQLSQHCGQGLEQFDSEQLLRVKDEVKEVMDSCNQSNMKEVKGLEERLYGLEKLMCESKKIVDEQRDLAQAFYQNQARASNLRDPSILPDLCASHQQQLQVMLKNHQKLRDIRRRCARAKEELSGNLHARLRWIVFIEKKLSEVDSRVLIYRENIRRLKKHLKVVHQIHLAPKIYLASVVEVVRRKTFSSVFLEWATSLAQNSANLVENEIQTRQTFSTQLETHFLRILFPGMNDFPPHRDEEMKAMKSEIAAKCQVNFNEALNKLSNERELLAQELAVKDSCIQADTIETQGNEMLVQIESELKSLTNCFDQKLNESVICDTRPQCSCNLANVIKEKELEISRLNRILRDSDMSQSSSAIGRIERVSVLGCEVGDIVLIYYEEKFNNYIVFTLNNVLHFVHTDCLDALSLKSEV
ncbi:unnamed protein product, partial [Medioppia subpectinata]